MWLHNENKDEPWLVFICTLSHILGGVVKIQSQIIQEKIYLIVLLLFFLPSHHERFFFPIPWCSMAHGNIFIVGYSWDGLCDLHYQGSEVWPFAVNPLQECSRTADVQALVQNSQSPCLSHINKQELSLAVVQHHKLNGLGYVDTLILSMWFFRTFIGNSPACLKSLLAQSFLLQPEGKEKWCVIVDRITTLEST